MLHLLGLLTRMLVAGAWPGKQVGWKGGPPNPMGRTNLTEVVWNRGRLDKVSDDSWRSPEEEERRACGGVIREDDHT